MARDYISAIKEHMEGKKIEEVAQDMTNTKQVEQKERTKESMGSNYISKMYEVLHGEDKF